MLCGEVGSGGAALSVPDFPSGLVLLESGLATARSVSGAVLVLFRHSKDGVSLVCDFSFELRVGAVSGCFCWWGPSCSAEE